MDQDLNQRLTALEAKIDKIYKSAETARKIFLWTAIISIVLIILPLIGLAFAIPQYLQSLNIQGL